MEFVAWELYEEGLEFGFCDGVGEDDSAFCLG